jgi:maspardin
MNNALIAERDAFAARHPEKRVVVNGREWGLIDTGLEGPALVLIPGTLGRGDIFWQQIAALKTRARILALTYPLDGDIAAWADDIAEIMAMRSIARASVLGSSLGGYLVKYFAAVHPGRVDRLIAANTLHAAAEIRERPPYSSDLHKGPIEELRAGFGNGLKAWAEAHPDQADLVGLLLAEVGGRIPERELRRRLIALKEAPELPKAALPRHRIVTVEADDDPLIPPPMRQAVRDALAPQTAYRFLWGGHFPYVVRPELYTGLIEEQLGLVPDGQRTGAAAENARDDRPVEQGYRANAADGDGHRNRRKGDDRGFGRQGQSAPAFHRRCRRAQQDGDHARCHDRPRLLRRQAGQPLPRQSGARSFLP